MWASTKYLNKKARRMHAKWPICMLIGHRLRLYGVIKDGGLIQCVRCGAMHTLPHAYRAAYPNLAGGIVPEQGKK